MCTIALRPASDAEAIIVPVWDRHTALAPAKPGDYFDARFDPEEDAIVFRRPAGSARRHELTIATGNDRDFKRPGLKVFNPFKELP